MKLNKQILAAMLVTTVSAGSIIGISATSAHSSVDRTERTAQLAEKLGVEQSAVEGALDEIKAEKQAERETERAAQLAELVSNGTLTQAQADALSAKQGELKAEREALRDSGATREEIKTQMEKSRDAFKAWAEEQGIDLDAISPEKGEGFGHQGHRGHGPHGHEDANDTADES
jgi:threonine aldolase